MRFGQQSTHFLMFNIFRLRTSRRGPHLPVTRTKHRAGCSTRPSFGGLRLPFSEKPREAALATSA